MDAQFTGARDHRQTDFPQDYPAKLIPKQLHGSGLANKGEKFAFSIERPTNSNSDRTIFLKRINPALLPNCLALKK